MSLIVPSITENPLSRAGGRSIIDAGIDASNNIKSSHPKVQAASPQEVMHGGAMPISTAPSIRGPDLTFKGVGINLDVYGGIYTGLLFAVAIAAYLSFAAIQTYNTYQSTNQTNLKSSRSSSINDSIDKIISQYRR